MKPFVNNLVGLCAVMSIPLGNAQDWVALKFRKIPAHTIEFQNNEMKVRVRSSAQPLIYKFPEAKKIYEFSVELAIDGVLKDSKKNPDSHWEEDSVFRLGLVARGEKTLNWAKRLIAAEWVKTLFDLAPKGMGIERINFYNVSQNKGSVGQSRVHPSSELMHEEIVAFQSGKAMTFHHKLPVPIEAVALWLSIDGDDSKSDYTVVVKKIELGE